MNELVTNAVVLDTEPSRELDSIISLFTEKLGKIEARATSSRKITSKLAGHLQPLHIVRIRLAHKSNFRITDALTIRIAQKTETSLKLVSFVNEMTAPGAKDGHMWIAITKALDNPPIFSYHSILAALGFNPKFAECVECGAKKVIFFSKKDFHFLCQPCGNRIIKNNLDDSLFRF